MATGRQQSGTFQQTFKNITVCPICMQNFTDPRILPCVHTFCAKCLETTASKSNYTSGKPMPCPMCRREFQIPLDGMKTMPKHFFMVKLLEMSNFQNSSQTCVVCDVCSEDNLGDVAICAMLFCRQCCLKLCESCCKHHRKNKLTKEHELISVDDYSAMTDIMSVTDICDVHRLERLKIYCSQCNKVLCAFCFIENHQNHNWLDVSKAGEQFRQQIQAGVENLKKQSNKIGDKKTEVYNFKGDVVKIASAQESMIIAKKNSLIQLMEKLVRSLIAELDQKRQEKLKEIQIELEKVDFQMQIQQSYTTYCHEIATKGSPVDFCRVHTELRSRAEELQRLSQSVCQRKTKPFEVDLRMNRFDELQKLIEKCFVGSFEGKEIEETSRTCVHSALHFWERRVTGMAIIDQELYVTTERSSLVRIYNSGTFKLTGWWPVTGLTCPEDMTASEGVRILYIFDAAEMGEIYRVNTKGTILSSWKPGSTNIRISATFEPGKPSITEANVIVTFVGTQISEEFEPSKENKSLGQMVFKENCTFVRKPKAGVYLMATSTEVCSVRISKSSSHQSSPMSFCRPEEIVVDRTTGFIFVNDRGNRRVVMLNSLLEYKKEIISPEAGLCDPRCMVLDGRNRRIVVANFNEINKCARILAVKID